MAWQVEILGRKHKLARVGGPPLNSIVDGDPPPNPPLQRASIIHMWAFGGVCRHPPRKNCHRKTHKNGIYATLFGENTLRPTPKIQISSPLGLFHTPRGLTVPMYASYSLFPIPIDHRKLIICEKMEFSIKISLIFSIFINLTAYFEKLP